MHLTWHGFSCVRIQTKDATLLIDPFPGTLGLSAPRLQADALLFSSLENPQLAAARKTDAFLVEHAGEYETRGVVITGVAVHQQEQRDAITLYTLEAEGVLLGFLGGLRQELGEDHIAALKDVDVLFVPAGGHAVLTGKQAVAMVSRVEPRIAVPYYYKTPGVKLPLDDASAFAKELGIKTIAAEEKLRLSRKELPDGDMKTIFLQP